MPLDFRIIKFSVLAALALAATVAHATTVDTTGVTRCQISGWSKDKDPAGLNVRAAPRADAPVIATLPPERRQGHHDTYAVEFRIIGSRDGWLLIEKAKIVDYENGKGDRVIFAGPGWVSGGMVGFEINDANLRAAPSVDAKVIATLMDNSDPDGVTGPDGAAVDRVYGCEGGFADVDVHMPRGQKYRGWAARICSNQVTTCV